MAGLNGETRKPAALLGMPGYGGGLTPGAARGFYRASSGANLELSLQYEEGSLLAENFNRIWCVALNRVHGGVPVDYFAMLHADCEPEDLWLDKLIAELEARDLDVLGVVAPVKDPRGMTSVALARPDGDPWRVHCRLTMAEVFRLPETFTGEDVGFPLLINTGCWVCRFSESWARDIRFTVQDRIAFNAKTGTYHHQSEPEDWNFSRQLHEMGKRVGCTRKVQLGHRGSAVYVNHHPWGQQDYDEAHVPESVVKGCDAFTFPHGVDGWLLYQEGRALWELARGKDVLEIGSFCGLSTICVAQSANFVLAVDPFDGRATPEPGDTLDRFQTNLAKYGVAGRVTCRVGTSSEVLPHYASNTFDLVFIDGAHDRESVDNDIVLALRVLKPGGLIAFHDYREYRGQHDGRWDPGVTAAVHNLIAAGGELLSTHGSLAVVRPPAAVALEV